MHLVLTPGGCVKRRLCGANDSTLSLLGGIFISLTTVGQTKKNTHTLCYIQQDIPGKMYLSRTACEKLGIIGESFPHIGATRAASDRPSSDRGATGNCTCPTRVLPPSPPTNIPYPSTEDNREKLESWILNHYSSSTFNVCEHQPLPKMSGPPLQLIIRKDATPRAVHTPVPIPIHWQKSAKASLDRDVELGVMEPVP